MERHSLTIGIKKNTATDGVFYLLKQNEKRFPGFYASPVMSKAPHVGVAER
ncbi:hypothetical protein SAMN02982996_01445 [Lonsdalea quercina]|uniref:Uncharacterized protein n=1 Tax=Lonsdalea quercina TaxID=71657 RepID=A0A1H4AJ97_9GAMM|nr:hypothetical protein SAMN02982996_01445 [Lonsdalea quercina]